MSPASAGVNPLRRLLLIAAILLYPPLSLAIELGDQASLHGFYSLDLSYSDSNGAVIPTRYDPIMLDEGDSTTDASLIGAQLDYRFSDALSFTLQAIATGQSDDDFDPSIDWAYVSYDSGNDLRLRAGRLVIPLLQGTELRYVGFSRLWARPLVPTNGAGGFEDYDAFELLKNYSTADYNLTFQAALGRANHHQDFVENNHVVLVSSKIEKNDSWVNLALMQADYDVDTRRGDDVKDGAKALMGSIEGELRLDQSVVNAGYSFSDAEASPDEQLIYLSIGYQLQHSTPYLLFMQREMEFDAADAIPPGAPPPPPGVPLLNGTLRTRSTGLGIRYELADSYTIKLQLDYWQQDDDSRPPGPIEMDGKLFTVVFEGVF